MALELVAIRLFAPYFGYSVYMWGSMISVILLALSCGYAAGGWMADRSRTDTPLYLSVLGSGVYQLILLFVSRPVLLRLWRLGDITGPITATLVIFAIPMTMLAASSPYIIRLLFQAGRSGSVAGAVFALATAGGVGGTLITSFYLVPRRGTAFTLELLCAISTTTGIAGLWRWRRVALAGMPMLLALAAVPRSNLAPGELWRMESPYNYIRVMQSGDLRWLVLNSPRYFHTVRKLDSPWSGYYVDNFALGPLLAGGHRLLALGMGGGESILVTLAAAPDTEVDGVEIDPEVVQAGLRFFDLPANHPHVHLHVSDARPWLARESAQYDIVQMDLYQGGPYIPFYLATLEFFHLVRDHMANGSVLMMNVFDQSKERLLLHPTAATLLSVFPSLAVIERADGNNMLLAFPNKRSLESIRMELKTAKGPREYRELADQAAASINFVTPPSETQVFTDDRAPVEELTRRILLESGE